MAAAAPLYDLVLMLDPAAPEGRDVQIVGEVESAITTQGELVGKHDWGERELAYEIEHKTRAHYHLFQFHGPRALVEQLQRNLRVADGVIRFRIVKLAPGTPPPPSAPPAAFTPGESTPDVDDESGDVGEGQPVTAAAEAEPEAAPGAQPEAPVEPAPEAPAEAQETEATV
jgi:small subunit ribosomal protein S6